MEVFTMRWSEPRKKVGRNPSAAAALFDRELPLNLRTTRAIEYAAPTHSARTTTVYSVSFPVWAEWSHRSNNSTNGQAKQTIKTSPTASDDLNRICRSIPPSGNSRHRNYGRLDDSRESIADLGLISFTGGPLVSAGVLIKSNDGLKAGADYNTKPEKKW